MPVPTFFKRPDSTEQAAHTPTAHPACCYSASVPPPPDLDTQVAHAVYLARAGIRGLTLLGSTGEAVHLSNAERFAIVKSVRDGLAAAGFPNYPIIAGTASNSIDEVVQQLGEAKNAGAQWGLVLAPGYFAAATGPDGVVAWFTAVADRSPLPIMIYHYPGVSNNVKLPPSVYHRLAPHPNIVGCKLSHGDVSVHAQVALHPSINDKPEAFAPFTGLGQHLLPVMSVGFVGAIDGSAGFFPRTLVRLFNLAAKAEGLKTEKTPAVHRRNSMGLWERDATLLSKEERKELRELQYKVSAMEELVVAHGTVGIKEAISRLRLFGDIDGTRLPLMGGLPGGDAEWAKWGEVVGAVEVIEQRLEAEAVGLKSPGPKSPQIVEEAVEDAKEPPGTKKVETVSAHKQALEPVAVVELPAADAEAPKPDSPLEAKIATAVPEATKEGSTPKTEPPITAAEVPVGA